MNVKTYQFFAIQTRCSTVCNDNQLINCAVNFLIFLELMTFCHIPLPWNVSSVCFVCDKLINNVQFASPVFLSWGMRISDTSLQLKAHFSLNLFEFQRDMTNRVLRKVIDVYAHCFFAYCTFLDLQKSNHSNN